MRKGRQNYWMYIVFLILFILISYFLRQINSLLPDKTGSANTLFLYFLLSFILYSLCGAILGFEFFAGERKKEGKWSVRVSKLIILGLPSMIIGLYGIIHYVIPLYIPIYTPDLFSFVYIDFSGLVTIMQIIFGFTLTTSFKKTEVKKNNLK